MCNLPPDSQQALAIFGRRSPFKASGPVALVFLRLTQQLSQIRDRLQVTLAQFQSIFELSYLPVVCDSIEPPPVIVIVQGAPNCPMKAPTITVWITSGDLAT